MTDANNEHRPLRSGVLIKTGVEESGAVRESDKAEGTLTGVATHTDSDGNTKKVLVTCEHVMSGLSLSLTNRPAPFSARRMYQPLDSLSDTDDLVGSSPEYRTQPMDVAICDLAGGVLSRFELHDPHGHTEHTGRKIANGALAPKDKMVLTVLGGVVGETQAVVLDTDFDPEDNIGQIRFTGVVRLRSTNLRLCLGDSGAGCFYYDSSTDTYRLVCIVFAIDTTQPGSSTECSPVFLAIPASKVEDAFGIEFGKPTPVARGLCPAMGDGWLDGPAERKRQHRP